MEIRRLCAQPPHHQSQYLPGQKSFPLNDEVIVFETFRKNKVLYWSVLFCSVSQGCHMGLCWLVGMSLESDKARKNKATSSLLYASLFLLQSLNMPHITLHRAANPYSIYTCHIWNKQTTQSSPFPLRFSLTSQSSKSRLSLFFSIQSRL